MTAVFDGGYSNPEFTFGDRVRKIRREVAHMTQSEMARELGVGTQAYSAWETGRTKPDDVVAIAKRIALRWRGVTAAWVLGVDDDGPTPPGPGGGAPAPLPDGQSGGGTTGLGIKSP